MASTEPTKTGEKELFALARELGAGVTKDNIKLRLIRCTCKPGQWPCECDKPRRFGVRIL